MNNECIISFYLDTRRPKQSGKFPVKLRVYQSSTQKRKLYPTKFEFSEKEFESIWETVKPRQEYKQIRLELQALENKANEVLNDLTSFTFPKFEKKLYMKKGEGEILTTQYTPIIERLKSNNQFGTADNYRLSLKSITDFYQHKKGTASDRIYFSEITPDFLEKYESYMLKEGKTLTTVSMYLRALRTVFNAAILDKEIDPELYPFGKGKYEMPSVSNVKKAFTPALMKKLFDAVPKTKLQETARDFWFFSYACNGINIKDIALLKYKSIQGNELVFYRSKTGRTSKKDLKPITVYLDGFPKEVIKKYGNPDIKPDNYIFQIVDPTKTDYDNFRAIKNFITSVNKNLKKLMKEEGIEGDISTYAARHSFATNAIVNGASMEFVSEALGHNDFKTTENYFKGFPSETKKDIAKKLMNFNSDEQ